MASRKTVDVNTIFREGIRIDAALRRAARDAILLHRRLGLPVVVWRNSRPTWVDPREFDVELGLKSSRPAKERPRRSRSPASRR